MPRRVALTVTTVDSNNRQGAAELIAKPGLRFAATRLGCTKYHVLFGVKKAPFGRDLVAGIKRFHARFSEVSSVPCCYSQIVLKGRGGNHSI